MPRELHDYQKQAVRFALDAFASPVHGCGLFLEPGLGKTAVSIAIMDIWRRTHPDSRFLVIAPTLVARHSWPDELDAWRGVHRLDWALCWGTPKQRKAALEKDAAVTIINQENVAWLDKTLKRWPFDGIVVDELSGFKNTGSARHRALARRRKHAAWALGLTGTPATRELDDLFGEIRIIDAGLTFGTSVTRFRETWMRPTKYIDTGYGARAVAWRPRAGAQRTILDRIRPFCLSMRAKDKLPGLPDMIETDRWIAMPETTRDVYRSFQSDRVADLGDTVVTAASAPVLTAKLDQLASGCLYPDADDPDRRVRRLDDAKLDELARILDAADGPVLVFYRFRDELARLRDRFGVREVHEKGALDEWRTGHVPIMAAQPAAAKFGLNIQGGGHEIVWLSLPWAFDDYKQACDRLHRQGQSETVVVHRILEDGTIDRHKLDVLTGRATLHDAVLDALKRPKS